MYNNVGLSMSWERRWCGAGDDIIFGLAEDDYINGGDGSDVIYGNLGLDIIIVCHHPAPPMSSNFFLFCFWHSTPHT